MIDKHREIFFHYFVSMKEWKLARASRSIACMTSMEYLIGTGGWAYFQVLGQAPLEAYSKTFNFVEVNSTYYNIPPIEMVKSWRNRVPKDFKFSVRAHGSIANEYKFQLVPQAVERFHAMGRICTALEAEILHFQIPISLTRDSALIKVMNEFFSSINLGNIRIALEIRGTDSPGISRQMVNMMKDRDMIHCVDLSKGEKPAYDSDTLYTRLFGPCKSNIYQPTDKELADLDSQASSNKHQKVAMSFHFVKMYKDAARMKIYRQTNRFPKVTSSVGITSLREILSEDARFPITKHELVQHQGWKLFDYTEKERIRSKCVLEKLSDKIYTGMDDIIEELKRAKILTI